MKKKTILFLTCCLFLAFISGCREKTSDTEEILIEEINISSKEILSTEKWGDYFEKCGELTYEWAKSITMDNLPSSMVTYWWNEGGVDEKHFDDTKMIVTTFNSLAALNLGEEVYSVAEDNSVTIEFKMKDGTTCYFGFNDENAEIRGDKKTQYYDVHLNQGIRDVFSAAMSRD